VTGLTSGGLLPPASIAHHQVVGFGQEQGDESSYQFDLLGLPCVALGASCILGQKCAAEFVLPGSIAKTYTGGPISTELRINDRIRVPEVRLVGPNGETVGIVSTSDALRLAQEADLDLVEIAPMGRPPVCKLMDYGKFKYENAQKAREARRNQTNTVIKEMKLRPKIDQHDYETKKGHVVRFLRSGDKVKITIMFRGREQHRPELGYRLLQRLAEDVTDLGFVESSPKQDGRNMTMVIGPHKKKSEAKAEVKAERDAKAAERTAEREAERAELKAAHPSPSPKKEKGRSENLDPEIEA
jgi:translation initiation factor IF-3